MEFKYILASLATVAAIGTSAQGLHQEIDVEREIVPVERDATRINTLPTLVLPPITPYSSPVQRARRDRPRPQQRVAPRPDSLW